MTVYRPLIITAVAGLLTFGGVAAAADSAEAQSRTRQRSTSVSGPHHSAASSASISRSAGSTTVSRSGTFDGQTWSSGRSRTTIDTGDGYATTAVRTGPAGNTQTRTTSVSSSEDGYSRDTSVQTSNGYGYQRQVDAARDANGSTVNRSATTNSGATRSSTVTRPY
ncbi:MAG: hypothetical protein A2352_02970 [Caulobacterales bacterium RIFOXYB1_FULL_67_16]|jgi:hypothetical protein|nr:MAG: hypothetical protein A2352_02970 [Caulobacterales bacterium RIFOXYB1_FULL_67_16]